MAIEFKRANLKINNNSGTFSFSGPVREYVLGISYWEFSFADGSGHQVKKISVHVAAAQPDPAKIEYTINAEMSDNSGATISPESWVQVSCIADVGQGAQDNCVRLENSTEWLANGHSAPLSPGADIKFMEAILSGFEFEWSSHAHDVWKVDMSSSYSSGEVTAVAKLQKAKDPDLFQGGSIHWGLVSAQDKEGRLACKVASGQNDMPMTIDFADSIGPDTPIAEAITLLQSFNVTYASPNGNTGHWVKSIGGGVKNTTIANGSPQVRVTPSAFINDSSGNQQDPSSSVKMVVVVCTNVVVLNDERCVELRVVSDAESPNQDNSRWEYLADDWHGSRRGHDGAWIDEIILRTNSLPVTLRVSNETSLAIKLQVTGNDEQTIPPHEYRDYQYTSESLSEIGGCFLKSDGSFDGPLPDPTFKITRKGS